VGGIKGGGHKALGGGVTIGETSSDLSISLRPPKKKSIGFPIVNGVLFFVMAAGLANDMIDRTEPVETSDWVFLLILIAIGLWCIRLVIMRLKFNKDVFPRQSKSWNAEFICLRCSRRFRVS